MFCVQGFNKCHLKNNLYIYLFTCVDIALGEE